MHGSRESSVWRTLAVAFGDGVAFGVGLTLTNKATRTATSRAPLPQPDTRQLADRVMEIERRIDRVRQTGSLPAPTPNRLTAVEVADALLAGMDNRFGEINAQIECRLAELEAKIKGELEALDARDRAQAQDLQAVLQSRIEAFRGELAGAIDVQRLVGDEIRVLRSGMAESNKEFAESLAHIVDEQIEHAVGLRLRAIQDEMRETVRDECLSAYAGFGNGVETLIEARFRGIRVETEGSDREIAELRARLDGHEHALRVERDTLRGELADINALHGQIVNSHKEFAESNARLVDEKVEHAIGLRLQAIQEQMRAAVRDESLSAVAGLGNGLESLIEKRFQGIREEMEGKNRQIAALRGEVIDALTALRGQIVDSQRQFAETTSRLVDEQIEHTIGLRLQTIQEQMRGQMESQDRQIASLRSRNQELEAGIESRIEALRSDLARAIEAQRGSVDGDVSALRGQMESRSQELEAGIEPRIEALRGDLTGAIGEVSVLRGQMVSRNQELGAGIESRIGALRADLTGAIGDVSVLRGQMESRNQELEAGIESRIEALRADLTGAIEAQLSRVDGDVSALRGQTESQDRQIADVRTRNHELEAVVESRIEALRADLTGAIETQLGRVYGDINALRGQMAESHKEFAETLARVTEEQVEHTVSLRLQALQEQMREAVRDESINAYAGFGNAAETLIETRVQGFRQEMDAKDRHTAELRARLDGHEQNLLQLVLGLGQRCMQAADLISVPAPSPPKSMSAGGGGGGGGAASFPADTLIAPAGDPELPSFARHAAPRILWRIPIASCFLLAGGLLTLHYLAA